MNYDDEICICYDVTLRKLVNFAKRECPKRPSQMTECLSAGTGCGWCIPILKKIAANPEQFSADEIEVEDYTAKRAAYLKKSKESKEEKNRF